MDGVEADPHLFLFLFRLDWKMSWKIPRSFLVCSNSLTPSLAKTQTQTQTIRRRNRYRFVIFIDACVCYWRICVRCRSFKALKASLFFLLSFRNRDVSTCYGIAGGNFWILWAELVKARARQKSDKRIECKSFDDDDDDEKLLERVRIVARRRMEKKRKGEGTNL